LENRRAIDQLHDVPTDPFGRRQLHGDARLRERRKDRVDHEGHLRYGPEDILEIFQHFLFRCRFRASPNDYLV
jgi:hypothetical protein